MYTCARTLTLFGIAEKGQPSGGIEGMKRAFTLGRTRFVVAVIAILSLHMVTPRLYAQAHKAVNLSDAKGLPFSDGIIAGKTLYVAGQEGSDDSGKLVAGGIGPETTAALKNIQKVLKAAGFELKDVVNVTVYLADIHEFPDMNKVYKTVMPDPKPARATVQVAALVNNARIEISAIAVKSK
jgi:2-iminobutanoate/2-iminopropanoate deaminase